MIDAGIDVAHDWREARSRKVVARLLYGLRTRHLAEQFRGFDLVWCESDPDVAVRDDTLVVTISVYDLADVLSDEVRLQSVPSHVRQSVGENLHAIQRWKLVDK